MPNVTGAWGANPVPVAVNCAPGWLVDGTPVNSPDATGLTVGKFTPGITTAVTVRDAAPVAAPFVPVTVYVPSAVDVHDAAVQTIPVDPVNAVAPVISPRLLPNESKPSAVKSWEPPATIVPDDGDTTK